MGFLRKKDVLQVQIAQSGRPKKLTKKCMLVCHKAGYCGYPGEVPHSNGLFLTSFYGMLRV